jgi:hypothetical protein
MRMAGVKTPEDKIISLPCPRNVFSICSLLRGKDGEKGVNNHGRHLGHSEKPSDYAATPEKKAPLIEIEIKEA